MAKVTCSFCTSNAIYKDGVDAQGPPHACGNHFMRLADPKAIDPVSARMAAQLKEMLTDPDEDADESNYLED